LITGTTQQLNTAAGGFPSFSGSELAYSAGGHIFLYDLVTQAHTLVVSGGGLDPALSSNWLAYSVGTGRGATIGVDSPGSNIAVLDRTSGVTTIVSLEPFNSFLGTPVLFDDSLIFRGSHFDPSRGFTRSDIYILDLTESGPPVNITSNPDLTFSGKPSATEGLGSFSDRRRRDYGTASPDWPARSRPRA
jgi:hypothetical protein